MKILSSTHPHASGNNIGHISSVVHKRILKTLHLISLRCLHIVEMNKGQFLLINYILLEDAFLCALVGKCLKVVMVI